MLNRELTSRERTLAIVTAALVSVSVLYLFALEPAAGRWREVSARLDAKEMELERSRRMAEAAGRIEGKFTGVFRSDLTVEEAVNGLMDEVRSLAGAGVRITGVRPAPPSREPGFRIAKAQVEFEGTIEQATGLLYGIEKASGVLWIERCQLSPAGAGSNLLRGTAIVCKATAGRDGVVSG